MPTSEAATGVDRWRYVIVLAKFMVHVLHPGIPKSLSTLIPSLVFQLDLDYSTVGFLIALEMGILNIACPISYYLSQKLGSRQVSTVGGLLAGISLMTGCFSNTATSIGCSFFFTGFFASSLRQVSSESLHQHFGEELGLPVTITQLGSQVGSLLLPYLTVICLNAYGMRGAIMFLSALMFHGVPIGAAMRPPRPQSRSKTKEDYHLLKKKDDEYELLQTGSGCEECNSTSADKTTLKRDLHPKDLHANLVLSAWTFIRTVVADTYSFIKKERVFTFLLLPCQLVFDFCYVGWAIFLFSYGISAGLSMETAVYLVTSGSVGGITGRIVLIAVFYKYPLVSTHMLALNIGIASVALLAYEISSSLIHLVICSSFAGFGCYNAYSSLYTAFSLNAVQKKNFPTMMAYSMMFSGISYLISGMLTGFMYDLFGSYRIIFRTFGILLAAVSIAMLTFIWVESRPSKKTS